MNSLYFHAGQLMLMQPIELVMGTINHYWVNLCGPLFWIASAVFLLWNLDCPKEEAKVEPPLRPEPLVVPRVKHVIQVKAPKKPSKKPFKSLKDQIFSWKKTAEDRGVQKGEKKKIPFLRRFSGSEESFQEITVKKKNFCSSLNKKDALQKLKLLSSKLKRSQ